MDLTFTRRSARLPARTRLAMAAASLLGVGLPLAAHAAVSENLATSPTAMSLGNAVTADPPGIESIHFNPAGLARVKGDKEFHNIFVASIRTSARFHAPDDFDISGFKNDPVAGSSSGPTSQKVYVPFYGMTGWRLPALPAATMGFSFNNDGSPFTFGTLTYVQQGMTVDHAKDPNDPMRFEGKQMVLQRLALLSPAVGYQVSDTLRIGASVPIANAAMVVNTDVRMPNKLLGIIGKLQEGWCGEGGNPIDTLAFGLCGGGPEGRINPFKRVANINIDMSAPIDPTINLGVLWEPTDAFAVGVVYQGGSDAVHTGTYEIRTDPMMRKFVEGMYASLLGPIAAAVTGMPTSIPEVQKGHVTATVPFPARWQVGFKFKPVKRVQLNVDANYQKWNEWSKLTFQFDQSIKLLEAGRILGITDPSKFEMNTGFRNVLHWGFGLQVQATRKLTLRFGYEPRKSSIPADRISLIAPLPDTKLYSVGFNLKVDRDTEFNVAASYLRGDFDAPARSSSNLNRDNFFNAVYNPYAGLDVAGGIRVRYFGFSFTKRF
ncbi:MAG: OmpP1/FadL family transporter [Bacillota bacterium]